MRRYIFLLFGISLHAVDVIYGPPPNAEVIRRVQKYLPQNPVIVEAGTYDGADTAELSMLLPSARIFTFEPVPELFQRSSENISPFSNITLFNLALSNSTGHANMYLSELTYRPGEISQSSSLLEPAEHLIYAPIVQFTHTITVPTTTLDDWANYNNIETLDFLKLDMQGCELDVMMASPKIFRSVQAVLTEVEFSEAYKGQYQFEEITHWFEEQGFTLDSLFINCSWCGSQETHAPWFGDALFIRKESNSHSDIIRLNQIISEIKISPH